MMRRIGPIVAVIGVVALVTAAPALAHVELTASSPADGDRLIGPVDEIKLTFSTAAEPAGEGIILYDEAAVPISSSVEIVSDTEVRVLPIEPLESGRYAVAWTMRAGDAHPREGTIEFLVEPQSATPAVGITDPPIPQSPTDPVGANTAAARQPILSAPDGPPAGAEWLGRFARTGAMLAALYGIGSLAFAYLVFEGSSTEARRLGYSVRRAGLALIAIAPLEILAQSALLEGISLSALGPTAIVDAASGGLGFAVALRVAGGIGLLTGTRMLTLRVASPPAEPEGSRGGTATLLRETFHVTASPIALASALALAVSFAMDGHSAVSEPNLLVRASSVVHVLAAATWLGGVVNLATVLTRRHRRDDALHAARLVIPFATAASVAVVYVGLAGSALALTIIDTPADLLSTGWGRILLAKLGIVAVAGAMGAYNHLIVVPALRLSPEDEAVAQTVRRTTQVESVVLIAIATITAILVGLSP